MFFIDGSSCLLFLLCEELIGKNHLTLREIVSTLMLNDALLAQFLLYFNMCLSMLATSFLMFCSVQDQTL